MTRRVLFALLPCLLLGAVHARAAEALVTLNDLVNGGFEGTFTPGADFTYEGSGRVTWTMAAPWWIGSGRVVSPGAGRSRRCLQLTRAALPSGRPGDAGAHLGRLPTPVARDLMLRVFATDGSESLRTGEKAAIYDNCLFSGTACGQTLSGTGVKIRRLEIAYRPAQRVDLAALLLTLEEDGTGRVLASMPVPAGEQPRAEGWIRAELPTEVLLEKGRTYAVALTAADEGAAGLVGYVGIADSQTSTYPGGGQFEHLPVAGSEACQPVGIVPGLGGRLQVVGRASTAGAGVLQVTVVDGEGKRASLQVAPRRGRWTQFALRAGATIEKETGRPVVGPCEVRLRAASGSVLVDDLEARCAYRRVEPRAFCARVLRDAAWAFETQIRCATDEGQGIPLEVRLYDVRTGRPLGPVPGSVNDDSVYRCLPLMYALTGDRRWRDRALAHARFALERLVTPSGIPAALDPATGTIDPAQAMGPLEYVQLFAWAARESGDPAYVAAVRRICDAWLRCARLQSGRLAPWCYLDGRPFFPNGEGYWCYDLLAAHALAVGCEVTGDERYAQAALDELRCFMRRGQWREWFDDPFGIPMNSMVACGVLTGRREFLDAAREGARFWHDRWRNSLQHGAFAAGDDPRTWPIYCHLGALDRKPGYADTARRQFLYTMKCQAFGGHWVEQFHLQYRPFPGFEYPPLNAMNGAGTVFAFTRDRDVLTRLAALYDDWNAFFRHRYGYRFTPDPKQPGKTQWMHGNTARVMAGVLRTVAAIKGVPVTPYAFLCYPASPREAQALRAAMGQRGNGPAIPSD